MDNQFQSSKPIYLQIADQIFYRLVRKELLTEQASFSKRNGDSN